MRGKSIDTEYVASFIQNCAGKNKVSPEDICEEALMQIEEIDKQLKMRLKLVDVLSFFNYKKKLPALDNVAVSFEEINKVVAMEIIGIIMNNPSINTTDMVTRFSSYSEDYKKDLVFTMKQMLETRIIIRDPAGTITIGPNYRPFNESK